MAWTASFLTPSAWRYWPTPTPLLARTARRPAGLNTPGPNELHRALAASGSPQLRGCRAAAARRRPPDVALVCAGTARPYGTARSWATRCSCSMARCSQSWRARRGRRPAQPRCRRWRARRAAGAGLSPRSLRAGWRDVAVLNLGGISNLSLLHADGRALGFDTGRAIACWTAGSCGTKASALTMTVPGVPKARCCPSCWHGSWPTASSDCRRHAAPAATCSIWTGSRPSITRPRPEGRAGNAVRTGGALRDRCLATASARIEPTGCLRRWCAQCGTDGTAGRPAPQRPRAGQQRVGIACGPSGGCRLCLARAIALSPGNRAICPRSPGRLGCACSAPSPSLKRTQTENDEPQPQVVLAFGFLITNCAPCRSSL